MRTNKTRAQNRMDPSDAVRLHHLIQMATHALNEPGASLHARLVWSHLGEDQLWHSESDRLAQAECWEEPRQGDDDLPKHSPTLEEQIFF